MEFCLTSFKGQFDTFLKADYFQFLRFLVFGQVLSGYGLGQGGV